MILLDTNLLARLTSSAHPHCVPSRRAILRLSAQGERLVIVPQNLFEFWAVATRKPGSPPAGQNGLGMTCNQAVNGFSTFVAVSYFSSIEPTCSTNGTHSFNHTVFRA